MARFPKSGILSLLGAAARFAEAQPALAGALAQLSSDAPLERVREGLFYLGATVIDQIRELEADGDRALADVVAPSLARPFPAASIVELSVGEGPLERVHAGAEITSRDPVRCRFRVVGDVDVAALSVEGVRLVRSNQERDALQFDLVATGTAPLRSSVGERLRLYVDGPREAALLLVAHVLGHGARAELTFSEGTGFARVVGGGLRVEDMLTPEPDGPVTGLDFLREYFLLPEKFSFLEIEGLPQALRDSQARRATVAIPFDARLPPRATLAEGGLCPNCAPVVNLFPATSEPRMFGPGPSRFPIRVAGLPREDGGIYAVLAASATPRTGASPPVRLPPLRRFGAATLPRTFPYAYSTKLVASTVRDEPDLFLAVTRSRWAEPIFEPHVLSLDLLATNRGRASEIRPGDLTEPGPGMPPSIRVRNIVPTSPYVPPVAGHKLALQAIVRAAVPRPDPLFTLKSHLFALVPRGPIPSAIVQANVARVEAIERLRVDLDVDRVHARRGYVACFDLDETPFHGLGDAALFLRILHRALDAQSSVNHFYRCEGICTKSATRLRWPPAGDS